MDLRPMDLRPMDLARLRNLGIVAHIDAGKTTVSERLLFYSGVEHRIGEVDAGTAVMDWMPEERERGITITAAATRLPWREHAINLIDTPGHVDFTIEVERSLRVLDGALLVIDAVAGVQAQSETVWRQMRRHRVPAVAFVNKCDRTGADFLAAVRSLEQKLGARAVPLQYPYRRGSEVAGVVDLLSQELIVFPPIEPGGRPRGAERRPVPAEVADEAAVLRAELLDVLSEEDEELIALLLEERELPAERLRRAVRRRTLSGALLPVLCGAALRNVGIQPLLDAVVDFLPAPSDLPPVEGARPGTGERERRRCDPREPAALLAFKVQADAHGDLTWVRLYSGRIASGDQLLNPRLGRPERVGRIVRMHADARTQLESAEAGDIVGVTGLKLTGTGDTLCAREAPILLEPVAFPEPVISMVVEPRSTLDRDKLRAALQRLAREDPTFHQKEDESTGQWLVQGMGELHLEVLLHRLASEHRLEAGTGTPRVAYREALRAPARAAARVDRQFGGKDVFGAVELEIAPSATPEPGGDRGALLRGGSGLELEFEPSCRVPQVFRKAVREALLLSAQVGPRFGFPLVDARIRVYGGESRPQADSEVAFAQAAGMALRQAMESAQVEVLEPLMRFEIHSPPEFDSGILADLNARGAEVDLVEVQNGVGTLRGTVPLAEMFGYSTAVRSLSQGRAGFSMQPAGFRPVAEAELRSRGLSWS